MKIIGVVTALHRAGSNKNPSTVAELVNNFDTQDVIVLSLSRAVQLTVDVGSHIISESKLPVPTSMRKVFESLQEMLHKSQECVDSERSFVLETTLNGRSYSSKIARWKAFGDKVVLFYFSLPDVDMAIMRVKHRVANDGHNIPVDVIKRRFGRSVEYLKDFKPAVDSWVVFDSSLDVAQLLEEK